MWNKILNNKKKKFSKLNCDFVRLSQKPLKMGIFQTWELIYNNHISSIATSKIIPCSFDLAQNSRSSLNRAKDRCSTKEKKSIPVCHTPTVQYTLDYLSTTSFFLFHDVHFSPTDLHRYCQTYSCKKKKNVKISHWILSGSYESRVYEKPKC